MDIIIVDDTQTAIDALAKKLKNYPNVTVAGFANNGKDGLELLKTCLLYTSDAADDLLR